MVVLVEHHLMRVRVLRALCIKGERQDVGKVVDLERHVALEAIHLGKVERVDEEPPEAKPKPMTTQSAPAFVAGKTRKSSGE